MPDFRHGEVWIIQLDGKKCYYARHYSWLVLLDQAIIIGTTLNTQQDFWSNTKTTNGGGPGM
jgi:hypothetical protein